MLRLILHYEYLWLSIVSQIWLTKLWDCALACGVAMQSESKKWIHLTTTRVVWPKYFVIQILNPAFGVVMEEHRKKKYERQKRRRRTQKNMRMTSEKSRIYSYIDNGEQFSHKVPSFKSGALSILYVCAVCKRIAVNGGWGVCDLEELWATWEQQTLGEAHIKFEVYNVGFKS